MIHDQSARLEAVSGAKLTLGELYPVVVFYALYAAVIGLYDALQPLAPLPSNEVGWIMLVTSPFNYAEAVGKTAAETIQGLYNNFTFVALLMGISMLYNILLSHRLRRYVSVPSIFGASVAASYLVSWGVWKFSPYPATGTSIIGFSFALSLAITAFADLIEFRKLDLAARREVGNASRIIVCSLVMVFAFLTAFNSYLWMNPSYLLHLAGAGCTLMFILLWREMGCPSVRKLFGVLLDERNRMVFFVVGIVLVVLLS